MTTPFDVGELAQLVIELATFGSPGSAPPIMSGTIGFAPMSVAPSGPLAARRVHVCGVSARTGDTGRVNLTERERGPEREPAQPALSRSLVTARTLVTAPLFVAVVRDDRRSRSVPERPWTRPPRRAAVVALTIATALCEIHTGHAVGEAMRSPAASTPRHRFATQAMAGVAACEDQMRLRAGGDAAPGVTALVR